MAVYNWLQAFRNRHSHNSTRKPEDFSLSRAMNLNEVVVKQHFDESFKVMSDNNITGHRVWNTVETGLQVFEPCDVIVFDYAWFSPKRLIAIKKFKMMEKLYSSKSTFENGDGSWLRYLPSNTSLLGVWHATDIISTELTPVFWYCVWKRQKIDTSHTLQVTTYNVIYTR